MSGQGRFRGDWARLRRGYGEVDEQGFWKPTYGPWHYAPARRSAHGYRGPGVTALCGASLYRRNDRDVARVAQVEPPEGTVCLKCKRLAEAPR